MYPVRMAVFAVGCLIFVAPAFGQEENAPPKSPTPAARPTPRTRMEIVDEFLKKYDKNDNGVIDRDELPAALRGRFNKLDDDKDGKLDREDLLDHVGVLRHFDNRQLRQDGREQRREFREERRDQRVQRREKRGQAGAALLQPEVLGVVVRFATSDEPVRTGVQMVYEVLCSMDKNKDGEIDHAEWQAALDKVREHRVEALLRRQGEDGKICLDNARGTVRMHFSQWDRNKDGFIDRAELRRAFNLKPEQPAKPVEEKVTTEPGEE